MLMDEAKNMPREYRNTLTDRILNAAYDLLDTLHFAYCEKQHRLAHLEKFQAVFGSLKTFVRIATERKLIPLKKSAQIFELIGDVGKQINGWRNATEKHSVPGA